MSRPARAVALVAAAAVVFAVGSIRSGLVALPRLPAAAPSPVAATGPGHGYRLIDISTSPSPATDFGRVTTTAPLFYLRDSQILALQAFTWDGRRAGTVRLDGIPAGAWTSWSPDGSVIRLGAKLIDPRGNSVVAPPSPFTFAAQSPGVCGVRAVGSGGELWVGRLGQGPRRVIGTYAFPSSVPLGGAALTVGGCDIARDRAIVFRGQGNGWTDLWAIRLHDGQILLNRHYAAGNGPVLLEVSPDLTAYAQGGQVFASDSGAMIRDLGDAFVEGFSADGRVVVSRTDTSIEGIDLETGKVLWDHVDQNGFQVVVAGSPTGRDFLVRTLGDCSSGCPQVSRYEVIHADGSATDLPGLYSAIQ